MEIKSTSGKAVAMDDSVFARFPTLESQRLVLRELNPSDAEPFFRARSDPKVMQYMDIEPYHSIEETGQAIQNFNASFRKQEALYWAITLKESGLFIGAAGYWRIIKPHFRAELGYQLLPEWWNQGYMREALRSIIRFGFEVMELHSIEANVNPQNLPSIRLLEKLGFVREGNYKENYYFQGKFLDTFTYSLLQKNFIVE